MNFKNKTIVFGQVVKEYQLPLEEIEQLNNFYEEKKEELDSYNERLAGRLDSELDFTKLIVECDVYQSIVDCMSDYMNSCKVLYDSTDSRDINLEIISCWINDMKAGEYNPPHVHNESVGWSTVLFLKIPHFINDVKSQHKFRDGQIYFHNKIGGGKYFVPEVGNFYIFEANHEHSVMPFKTVRDTDVRRSMSFNFIIK